MKNQIVIMFVALFVVAACGYGTIDGSATNVVKSEAEDSQEAV